MRIAVLSDTHGLLRESVLDRIETVDAIVHAGDVGKAAVLEKLESLAPTFAVRGNVDSGSLGEGLPVARTVELEGLKMYVIHDVADLEERPPPSETRLVIYGHSHVPKSFQENGIKYLNPGSIGRRRFKLPISFAFVAWQERSLRIEFVELQE